MKQTCFDIINKFQALHHFRTNPNVFFQVTFLNFPFTDGQNIYKQRVIFEESEKSLESIKSSKINKFTRCQTV